MVKQQLDSALEVVSQDSTIVMKAEEVSYLKAWSNYTFIHYIDKSILCSKTLKFYQEQLDDQRFIRTHRSYCVNKKHVEKINFKKRMITLFSGQEIPIARARKKVLKDLFENGFFSYKPHYSIAGNLMYNFNSL